MLKLFFISLAVLLVIFLLMAIGVIFGRRPIAGSCGGHDALKALGSECVAGCKEPCEKRRARMKAEEQGGNSG